MAYDELLADRIRDALWDQESLREQKMFGGLAFMVRDRMVVCVGTENRALLVRVDGGTRTRIPPARWGPPCRHGQGAVDG